MIVLHLQRGCHSNKMTSLSILLAAVFLGFFQNCLCELVPSVAASMSVKFEEVTF